MFLFLSLTFLLSKIVLAQRVRNEGSKKKGSKLLQKVSSTLWVELTFFFSTLVKFVFDPYVLVRVDFFVFFFDPSKIKGRLFLGFGISQPEINGKDLIAPKQKTEKNALNILPHNSTWFYFHLQIDFSYSS